MASGVGPDLELTHPTIGGSFFGPWFALARRHAGKYPLCSSAVLRVLGLSKLDKKTVHNQMVMLADPKHHLTHSCP